MKKYLRLFLFLIFIFSGYMLLNIIADKSSFEKDLRYIKEYFDAVMEGNQVDDLPEKYADVIGWIKIPNTSVSFPIVQGIDNEYYLTHSIDGAKNYLGSVFLDCTNNKDFSDPVSIIYGHNVIQGGVFSILKSFSDPVFLKNHNMITIKLKTGQDKRYEVIGFYEKDVAEIDKLIASFYKPHDNKVFLITCSFQNDYDLSTNIRYVLIGEEMD